MLRIVLLFMITVGVALAANDPRTVAEESLAAWHAADPTRLDMLAHPELKKRLRDARIVEFFVQGKDDKKRIIQSGSDSDVIAVFCEALHAIVPGPDKVQHIDRYLEAHDQGELEIVVFESVSRPVGSSSDGTVTRTEVVLKKVDEDWRFLWSPSVQLHVDLAWDPRK